MTPVGFDEQAEILAAEAARAKRNTPQAVVSAAPVVTAEQMDLVTRTVAAGATPDELKLYLYDCARQGVHPLDKLIHFTKRSGKYTPVTSIDFMRIRAAETGEYAGSDDAVFPEDGQAFPARATVAVWRLVQGQRVPFTATARWSEYKPEANDFMWRKMPHTMLAKCAEALALRKGFPRQLAGLYAKEEMDQAGPSNGFVEAPASGRSSTDVADRTTAPSAGNGGDSQHSTAPAPGAGNSAGGKRENTVAAPVGERAAPAFVGVLITKVEATTMPSGKMAGKPKWFVLFEDGNKASTIRAELAAKAQQLRDAGERVRPELSQTKWGYDLIGLFPVSATAPAIKGTVQTVDDDECIPF